MRKRIEEVVFARVAAQARYFKKRYAIMDRGAWGERIQDVVNFDNSWDFKGKIVDASTDAIPTVSKRIGFFHPLFCGYIFKGSAVEVVPNTNPNIDDDYIAIGQGVQTCPGYVVCLDPPPADGGPCVSLVGPCENKARGGFGGGYVEPLGSDNSYILYDKLTMTHTMGPNEIPALFELYGYDGGPPERPNPDKAVLLSWAPNHGAFQYTFQACQTEYADWGTQTFPVGSGTPWWDPQAPPPPDCCRLIEMWQNAYGVDWCATVAEMIRNGEITDPGTGIYSCQSLFDWITANC